MVAKRVKILPGEVHLHCKLNQNLSKIINWYWNLWKYFRVKLHNIYQANSNQTKTNIKWQPHCTLTANKKSTFFNLVASDGLYFPKSVLYDLIIYNTAIDLTEQMMHQTIWSSIWCCLIEMQTVGHLWKSSWKSPINSIHPRSISFNRHLFTSLPQHRRDLSISVNSTAADGVSLMHVLNPNYRVT